MAEDKYIGCVEGFIATTNVDSDGDMLAPEAIESMASQLGSNPKLRTMYLNHDMSQPVSEIIEFEVRSKGDWKGLWVKVGVFADRADVWRMMERGEITGFSFGARVSEAKTVNSIGVDSNDPSEKYNFQIEVDNRSKWDVKDILDSEWIQNQLIVRKALDAVSTIIVTAASLQIIHILYDFWQRRRESNIDINISINIGNVSIDFSKHTPEEIVSKIEANKENRLS
jgi:HK97 family phage prohead protease